MKKYLLIFTLLAGCSDTSELKTIGEWNMASDGARAAFIATHYASDAEMMTDCFNRLALMDSPDHIKLTEAAELCITSRLLRNQREKTTN